MFVSRDAAGVINCMWSVPQTAEHREQGAAHPDWLPDDHPEVVARLSAPGVRELLESSADLARATRQAGADRALARARDRRKRALDKLDAEAWRILEGRIPELADVARRKREALAVTTSTGG